VGVSKEIAVFIWTFEFHLYLQFKKYNVNINIMFLHKLLRQKNVCLNAYFSVFKRSTKFLSIN